jgi:predicted GIY-YIG superfamily endonuclease
VGAGPVPTPEPLEDHWVYVCFDEGGTPLYVGITGRSRARLDEHHYGSAWARSTSRIEVEHLSDRDQARARERELIRQLRPLHNVVHNVRMRPVSREGERLRQQLADIRERRVAAEQMRAEADAALAAALPEAREYLPHTEIAELLGIKRQALFEFMERWGVDRAGRRGSAR